jgi:hypothetical protein
MIHPHLEHLGISKLKQMHPDASRSQQQFLDPQQAMEL